MTRLLPATALLLLATACATREEAPKPVAAVAPPPPLPAAVVLDEGDKAILGRTLQLAASRPPGEILPWSNPANGKSGTLTVIRQGYRKDGRRCGEVHLDARQNGLRGQDVQTACQGSDGTWQPEGGFTLRR